MNRPKVAVRTPAPCSRPRRKPACTALTTLLATAAALVATAQAAPAGAATAPPPGPSPVSTPPPPEPAAAGASPHPPPAPGRPSVPHSNGGAQAAAHPGDPSPGRPPAARPANPPAPGGGVPSDPLPGTLAGLAPSAAATGVGGVLTPANAPAPAKPPAAPQTAPAPGLAPPAPVAETPGAPQPSIVPDAAEGAVSGVLTAELPDVPDSVRLDQQAAAGFLRANGIRWRSTGNCSDRERRTCTSFDGLRFGTLKGLLDFRAESGCPITITGGTERGHADGPRGHGTGYKLDIAPSRCVDAAIRRYPYEGVRGDGARLYRSPDGTLFARERDHWDITFG
jgi:hypothetical protein